MKSEPLKGKIKGKGDISNWEKVHLDKDIKSAVEFYKKYRDNPIDLWFDRKEYQKSMKKIFDIFEDDTGAIDLGTGFNNEKYNNWLFNITFEDIE